MKTMRKIFTLMLVMTMLLSMAITANATTVDPYGVVPTAIMDAGTITIKGSAAGTQYTIYRIFDIAQISNGEIVYLVNDNWKDFVNASDYFTIVNGYVKEITLTAAQLQTFAAAAMDWAEKNAIGFDGQSSELLNSGDYTTKNAYQYGYYIMTSNRQADDFQYSVFTLDQDNITVKEKSTVDVDITKQVQEDSEITQPGNGWGDENNAEIGQEVHFKIVVTVAAGSDPYIITDSMPKFKDIEIEEYRFSNGNIQEGYISYEPTADGFKITLNPSFRVWMEDGNTVEIYYKAKLTHDADLTNENIAKKFHYHPYYLSQLIRQYTGQPLHLYLIGYRIKMAKKMLITTDEAISTVAWKSGFPSPAYFTKQFKAQTGITPKAYRKEHLHLLF